jgi:O-antigen/teichoic acid export membrane protein
MLSDVQDRIRRFVSGVAGTSLQKLILRASSGTLGVKIVGAGLAFLMQIVLTRTLGAAQYGIYVYALTWAQLVALISAFGFSTASVRFVSKYLGQDEMSRLHDYLAFSRRTKTGISLGMGALFAVIAGLVYAEAETQTTFLIAALLPVVQSTLAVRIAEMRGAQYVVAGYTIEQVVRPVFVIVCMGAAAWVGWAVLSYEAMVLYVTGTTLAAGTAIWATRRVLPSEAQGESRSNTHTARDVARATWFRTARDMALIAGFNLILFRADTIMVGSLIGTEAAGLYAVASKGAGLVAFVIVAVNASVAPMFADLYAKDDRDELQSVVTFGARLILIGVASATIFLFAFAAFLLSLFGPEYVASVPILRILLLGQLANAAAGPALLLLNMTEYESVSAWIQGGCAVLNIGLNALLIWLFGTEGAAAATAITMITWNALALVAVYHYLRIDASFVGINVER